MKSLNWLGWILPPVLPWFDSFVGPYLIAKHMLPDIAIVGALLGFVSGLVFLASLRLQPGRTGLTIGVVTCGGLGIVLVILCTVVFPAWALDTPSAYQLWLAPMLWRVAYLMLWVVGAGLIVWGAEMVWPS